MTLNPYLMTEGAEIEEVVAGPADLSGQMVAWTSLGVWMIGFLRFLIVPIGSTVVPFWGYLIGS